MDSMNIVEFLKEMKISTELIGMKANRDEVPIYWVVT